MFPRRFQLVTRVGSSAVEALGTSQILNGRTRILTSVSSVIGQGATNSFSTTTITQRRMSFKEITESNWFRHCDKETLVPISGEIKGEIPLWLEGSLVRNGPGVLKFGDTAYNHLFDGQSLLHKFTISGGKATYQSRILQSDTYKTNLEKQRIVVGEFGTAAFPDPCMSLFERFKTTLSLGSTEDMTDNCNVNIAFYGDQLYAMTETKYVRRIDPDNLDTIGEKDIKIINTATAHPHVCDDGTILNLGSNYRHKGGPHTCIYKVPATYGEKEPSLEKLKLLAAIPARWKFNPAYYHSFGMTKDKVIFIESPLCLNIPKILTSGIFRSSFDSCLAWYGNEKTRIHLLSMKDGKPHPITYEAPAMFTFHHINAYEEDGQVICDVSAYNDAKVVKGAGFSSMQDENSSVYGATARRYVMPLTIPSKAKVGDNIVTLPGSKAQAIVRAIGKENIIDLLPEHLSEGWVELPRINYKRNGQKYNFAYGLTTTKDNVVATGLPEPDQMTKIDIAKGVETKYTVEKDVVISEPVFVADPNGKSEDDGVLLAALLYKSDHRDVKLVVINAKDMKELGSVAFKAEGSVTSTFHGQWHAKGARIQIH